ncbi:MAG: hypothetical protein E7546_01910 [Ruminococcaceae bacterium]|nr:hypothetical protein [Oscillospiraceae bacterium]
MCLYCGYAVPSANLQNYDYSMSDRPEQVGEGKSSTAYVVISALIPIVGLVLWGMKRKESPQEAKKYLIAALVTIGITILLNVICA